MNLKSSQLEEVADELEKVTAEHEQFYDEFEKWPPIEKKSVLGREKSPTSQLK